MIVAPQALPASLLVEAEDFLAMVQGVDPASFVPLGDFSEIKDGAQVEMDSQQWCAALLQEAWGPWVDGADVERAVRPGDDSAHDLLRQCWSSDEDLKLETVESAQFLLLRAKEGSEPVLGANDNDTSLRVDAFVDRVLRRSGEFTDAFGQSTPYRLELHYHPPLADGSRFSSAPEADAVVLPHWTGRLDGGVEGGLPFFILHKKHVSGDGKMLFLAGRGWFDGSSWATYGPR
ncbi:MAG: hypothetical protein VX498_08155 [Myxococcota bacterium]|nr:hypothetical protein [Myxococcota bacterium]